MQFLKRCARLALILSALGTLGQPAARAWNEQGHFLVARLAWNRLTPANRARVSEILRAHPHYEEYLTAERPVGVPTDEWAFLRAAYWPDWVRSNHSDEFSRPSWHYVTAAFTPPRSKIAPPEIRTDGPSVVTQIVYAAETVRTAANPADKAVYLCWLLHLTGDVHQPLHNCSLYDEVFPNGDRGGNLSMVRIAEGEPVRLHVTWDNLFGEITSWTAIETTAAELAELETKESQQIRADLDAHLTPGEWSKEGHKLACQFAYLSGDLAPANSELNPDPKLVPALSEAYLEQARGVARIAAIKAGHRLATQIEQALQSSPRPQ